MSGKYDADSIKLPSDMEHIFMRPGMYIGEEDTPKHLFVEAVDNAIDEAMNGYSNLTEVSYDTKKNEISVTDHGRGIPHGYKIIKNSSGKVIDKMSVIEALMTKNNSGGKFDNESFKIRGGLHGLGMKIINALSDHVWVQSRRDNEAVTYESHKHGHRIGDVKTEKMDTSKNHGTTIKFIPTEDDKFESTRIPRNFIISKCEIDNTFGYNIELVIDGKKIDLGTGKLEHLLPKSSGTTYDQKEFSVKLPDGESARTLLSYTSDTKNEYKAYTNLIYNSAGGTHVYAYQKAVVDAWKPFIGDKFIKPYDVLLGSKSIIAVFIEDPDFSSQTKERLSVPKKKLAPLFDKLSKTIYKYLSTHEKLREALLKRFEEYRMSQSKLQSQKEIDDLIVINDPKKNDGTIHRKSVIPKLKECTSRSRKNTELIITEGNSACLSGDTKVRLADGRNLTMKELSSEFKAGKKNYVYSQKVYQTDKFHPHVPHLEVQPIEWAGITRKNACMIRLHLDNDTYIDCTPDHKFMLIDGSYKEAQHLTKFDSLLVMPIILDREGHLCYRSKKVHQIIADQYNKGLPIGRKPYEYVIHHVDENKLNNTPENLKLLTNSDHVKLHSKERSKQGHGIGDIHHYLYYHDKKYHDRQKEIQAYGGHCGKGVPHHRDWSPEQRRLTSESTKNGMSKMSKEQKVKMRRNQKVSITLAFYKTVLENESDISIKDLKVCHTKVESNSRTQFYNLKNKYHIPQKTVAKWDTIKDEFKSDQELQESIKNANHKITKIESLDDTQDAYDLTVKDTHNFCLSNDVFVHNCGSVTATREVKTQAVFPVRGKVLNVAKNLNLLDNMKNEEVRGIVNSIGAGIGEKTDYTKSRYERVIISCFTGDTRIKLLDGTSPTFEELAQRELKNPNQVYWTYSVDTDNHNKLVPGKGMHPHITGHVDKLLKVTLNDGSSVKCTLDHKFLTEDYGYIEAKDLKYKMSLVPLCHHVSELTRYGNYKVVADPPTQKWVSSVEVIDLDKSIPVYCLTVEKYHNFAVGYDSEAPELSSNLKGSTTDNEGSYTFVHNCDADEDGYHIASLLSSLFINLLPELVKHEMVYVLLPPLYGWKHKNDYEFTNDLTEAKAHPNFTRYKGLGEMDKEEFYESCMNPKYRQLIKITYPEDLDEFNSLMTESNAKKELLEQLGLIDTRTLQNEN